LIIASASQPALQVIEANPTEARTSNNLLQTEAKPIHSGLQYFEASILQIESNTHSMSGLQII
jgi:hypothetical protein